MATTADGDVQLGFGIELEFVLQVKQKRLSDLGTYGYEDTHKTELAVVRNRQAVSKYLQAQLDAVELPCEIRTNYGGDKDYSMWGIEQDSSLKEGPGCCCEFHSIIGITFVNSLIRWYRDRIARTIRGLAREPNEALRHHRSRVCDHTTQLGGNSYSRCARW